jgi:hypothetical protein
MRAHSGLQRGAHGVVVADEISGAVQQIEEVELAPPRLQGPVPRQAALQLVAQQRLPDPHPRRA